MELNHIELRGEDGDDSFENCIPLCFDCHADMKSYDFKHPKGLKYTPSELRRHRDNWYKKVRESGAALPSVEYLELDRAALKKVQELLPWDGPIDFAKSHHFREPFKLEKPYAFIPFLKECENPAFEFIDADLESARADLKQKIEDFFNLEETSTWADERHEGYNRVPIEWEDDQPKRYKETIKKLNDSGSAVGKSYDQFIRLARRKLGAG